MARDRTATKAKRQAAINETMLPVFKKPLEIIGETFKVPGSFWGSACPAADANKKFVVAVKDFTLTHRDTPQSTPSQAFKLTELGEDGNGGNSVDFWMKYPYMYSLHGIRRL